MACNCTRKKCGGAALCCIGLLALIVGLSFCVLGFLAPDYLRELEYSQVKQKVTLNPKNVDAFETFKEVPKKFRFFVFNVTNAEDALKGERIRVEQVGPFTYDMVERKENIVRFQNGTMVKYDKREYYVYDPSESITPYPSSVILTAPNLPLLTLLDKADKLSGWTNAIMDKALSITGQKPFIQKSVQDLLWGYNDPILKTLSLLDKSLSPKFQLQKNDTWERNSVAVTGEGEEEEINKLGNLQLFDGKTAISCWGSTYANAVNGTDGDRFYPFVKKSDDLAVFISSLTRSVRIVFSEEGLVKDRVKTLNYRLAPTELMNAEEEPSNADFYAFGPSGLLNLTVCQGAPVFASKPHFLDGDPRLSSGEFNVEGLHPKKSEHDTVLYIEPMTGAVVKGRQQIQLNVAIGGGVSSNANGFAKPAEVPSLGSSNLLTWSKKLGGNLKPVFLPVFYGLKEGEVTDEQAKTLAGTLYPILDLSDALESWVKWVALAVGIVGLLLFILGFLLVRRARLDDKAKERREGGENEEASTEADLERPSDPTQVVGGAVASATALTAAVTPDERASSVAGTETAEGGRRVAKGVREELKTFGADGSAGGVSLSDEAVGRSGGKERASSSGLSRFESPRESEE
uniref:Uncharacterized protein n=1 Tax=Chromera velia CCMP2878 TaxID=1169474 RepID=A0A0G4I4Q2_9ALVE|mmetsp:Transcript_43683/g.86161  ORF Transcript_43683/g.86161 Transcript_43683/m.86161 type:complete len:630 (-) Transcript_43683:1034-2923(-)|eukprot:Cvel_10971.t1-p1 / transcript=Cvel_10971.t1 / gene=Cvel_10971 / organism=Chromera_velia_CCMP2878 / gene_product=Lysosome membrane protein 2, putative / transcript_product=Lysosome membrane protein 2, putative / location=Cvel_scaffold675:20470-24130(-) / protein_length=629 / sequence_SO=supercontig / SO=protein_coding / is_pseudo=false